MPVNNARRVGKPANNGNPNNENMAIMILIEAYGNEKKQPAIFSRLKSSLLFLITNIPSDNNPNASKRERNRERKINNPCEFTVSPSRIFIPTKFSAGLSRLRLSTEKPISIITAKLKILARLD
jgi:hypothetical protein